MHLDVYMYGCRPDYKNIILSKLCPYRSNVRRIHDDIITRMKTSI